ncbi:STAS domain-containing protein [Streptomyces sp. NPDC046727]|uniref:STAS domain-containing protein n=1 Tax=Streptomyces sp. NPDC046727 TaxID=3155373 RepID=UPI0033E61EE0
MSNTGGKQRSDQAGEHAPGAAVIQYEWRGAWVVAAHGSYDMHSIQPLADALNAAARKHPKVILDASGVDFADSTFLKLLILTHQTGTLRVAAPPEQLQRLFAITGADTVLEIRETVYAAAAS